MTCGRASKSPLRKARPARPTSVWGAIAVLGVGVGAGDYRSTNAGKIIAASFRDNYNNIVRSIRTSGRIKTAG
ncbi:MAG: hypothetical protein H0W08_01475 [Acidobacteria bacterium]|nr:hypothetical protein [Acidobacteriota bacterium]